MSNDGRQKWQKRATNCEEYEIPLSHSDWVAVDVKDTRYAKY